MRERIRRWWYKLQYNNIVAELVAEGRKEEELMSFEEWYKSKS